MEFISKELQEYVENHTSPESDVLKKLTRETFAKVMMPRMLSGHFQGRFLSMISKMIRPKRILEVGTYTGYSAISMAEGLVEGGKLITIDINEELESMVRNAFKDAEITEKIEYIIGDAMKILPGLNLSFDLVFIDADKINYINYYNLIFDKVNSGGYIIADNVLWSGKILNTEKLDKDTKALKDFNDSVHNDDRVENILLPLRDGLMVLRKK